MRKDSKNLTLTGQRSRKTNKESAWENECKNKCYKERCHKKQLSLRATKDRKLWRIKFVYILKRHDTVRTQKTKANLNIFIVNKIIFGQNIWWYDTINTMAEICTRIKDMTGKFQASTLIYHKERHIMELFIMA